MSKECVKFCDEHGIKRQLIVPYSPNKNGVVERKNRIFMSMAIGSTLKGIDED